MVFCGGQAAAQTPSFRLPVRGNRTAGLWVTASSQKLTVLKRDMNTYAGADLLVYQVRDAAGAVVHSGQIADDGNAAKGGGWGAMQSDMFTLNLTAGYHTVKFTNSGTDCTFDLQVSGARLQWNGSSLMLNDARTGGDLFFHAPAKPATVSLDTWHSGGNNQSVELWDGATRLSSTSIVATHTTYTASVPAQVGATPRVLRLRVPKMDINVSIPGVSGYGATANDLLPRGWTDWVYPLSQPRAVAPGGGSTLQLRLKNPSTAALTISFTLPLSRAGFALRWPSGSSGKVTLAAGAEATLPLELTCAAVTKLGSAVTLTASVSVSSHPTLAVSTSVQAVAAAPASVSPRARPFLFWSQKEITAAKARVADSSKPWAKTAYDSIIKSADGWLTASLVTPQGEGAWSGYYVCKSGPGLAFNASSPTKHYCATEGVYYSGEPYDSCWLTRRYNSLAAAARQLGVAYFFTKDARYARRALDILQVFSMRYLSYRYHDTSGGTRSSGGRLLSQTLDESGWLIKLLGAYDAIADSGVLSTAHKVDLEHNLLRPAVTTILRNDAGKSNWQAWHNAAVGAAGYALNEPTWVTHAISGTHGFGYHMKNSMFSDGMWYEGSIGYHLYTLSAYQWLALAAKQAGTDLYSQGLIKMVRAPVLMAFPDASFPKLNDGGSGNLSSMRRYGEVAAALTGDADTLAVLRHLYNDLSQSRALEEALLFGVSLGSGKSYAARPFDFAGMGYAVARQGAGKTALYAGLDYGPHGSWHGHYDKLQLVLHGGGKLLLADRGTTAYRLPYHAGYFKLTLPHNTVMFDETTQAGGNETPRKVKIFSNLSLPSGKVGLSVVRATVGADVFGSGRSVTRTVALVGDDYAVDRLDTVSPGSPITDLVLNGNGTLDIAGDSGRGPSKATAGWKNSKAGHAYLTGPTLSSGKAASVVEGQIPASTPVRFTFSSGRSISHDMDSISGISGSNIGPSKDKVQGKGAVVWTVPNDKKVYFISRRYTSDTLELSDFDTLEFSVKFSAVPLTWFGIKGYDLPTYNQAIWRWDDKTTLAAGAWTRLSANLKKPDASWGGYTSSSESITFRVQGSGVGPTSFTITLDDLVVKKGGVKEKPYKNGLLAEVFGGAGGPDRYLAADGLNNPPTSTQPMVLLRRQAGRVGFVSLLTPFNGSVRTRTASRLSGGALVVPYGKKGDDWLALDGVTGSVWWARRDDVGALAALGFVAASGIKRPNLVELAGNTGDLVLEVTAKNSMTYRAQKVGPFQLKVPWTSPGKVTATLDNKPHAGAWIAMVGSARWAVLSNLPDGTHTVALTAATTADGGIPDATPRPDLAVKLDATIAIDRSVAADAPLPADGSNSADSNGKPDLRLPDQGMKGDKKSAMDTRIFKDSKRIQDINAKKDRGKTQADGGAASPDEGGCSCNTNPAGLDLPPWAVVALLALFRRKKHGFQPKTVGFQPNRR